MEVNRLLSDELSYELQIRGMATVGTVQEKRSALRGCFRLEKNGIPFPTSVADLDMCEESQICTDKISEISSELDDFNTANKANEYQRINSRIIHLSGRIRRLDSTRAPRKSELMSEVMRLVDRLEQIYSLDSEENIITFDRHTNRNLSSVALLDEPELSLRERSHMRQSVTFDTPVGRLIDIESSTPTHSRGTPQNQFVSANDLTKDIIEAFSRLSSDSKSHNPSIRSNKWNISYDGESSLHSFLERVEELCEARGTHLALYPVHSIAELIRVGHEVEDAKHRASQFRPPPSANQSLNPDLAYRRPKTFPKLAEVETTVPLVQNQTEANLISFNDVSNTPQPCKYANIIAIADDFGETE
ncbi:hypothetical protein RN001_003486 [Aquatica leii]|uniref:Uncharacterized protein n=1 Tax=Aquatica leii TaxID=1421715 RepID=A0AAN7PF43_9COLE|nr:hypothetical protein RN001_003486 [Aquatica leii]